MFDTNTIYHSHYATVLPTIPDKSIDLILTTPPYEIVNNQYRFLIDLPSFWQHCTRIIKDNGVIALNAIQPFTSLLITSQLDLFRYCWYWHHEPQTAIQLKSRPKNDIEELVIFYKQQPIFNGQYAATAILGKPIASTTHVRSITHRALGQIIEFKKNIVEDNLYPKQMSASLCAYLIKTYTNPGGIVLDPFARLGGVGSACIKTGRKYILIEQDDVLAHAINHRLTFSHVIGID